MAPTNTHAPLMVRIPDAAAALGVSRRTVCSMIASGRLRAFKMNAATVIRYVDLDAFVATLPPVKLAA
jgi:excisionase family DNA binding protein